MLLTLPAPRTPTYDTNRGRFDMGQWTASAEYGHRTIVAETSLAELREMYRDALDMGSLDDAVEHVMWELFGVNFPTELDDEGEG